MVWAITAFYAAGCQRPGHLGLPFSRITPTKVGVRDGTAPMERDFVLKMGPWQARFLAEPDFCRCDPPERLSGASGRGQGRSPFGAQGIPQEEKTAFG